jgi:hypothetical protein
MVWLGPQEENSVPAQQTRTFFVDSGEIVLSPADKADVVRSYFPEETTVIARDAQVQVLREMADELNAAGNDFPANQAKGWHYASDYVANKADELEETP